MGRVSVDRRLLVGLAAVAGVALLTVAFLLGRASSPASPDAPPPGHAPEGGAIASSAPGDPALPPPTSPAPAGFPADDAPSAPAAEPSTPWPTDPPVPHAETLLPAPAPIGSASDPERAAVGAYLEALDRIRPAAIDGDAESVASSLATALASGDASGLEKLIRETEDARARLLSVAPPPACAAHHRESLGSLDDALEMLRGMKEAMASPEPATALATVAAKATALRSRAEALQREDRALRERYGVASRGER